LDEKGFTLMVNNVRKAEKAIGKVDYSLTERKIKSRAFSRSLYVAEDIKKGELITEKNVRSVRPGYGLHPKFLKDILGRTAKYELKKGTPVEIKFFD
jgi:pseudaminic acid synthase